MKSTKAWDLMAVLGLKFNVRAPSSTAHLEILPVASLLWNFAEREVGDDCDVVLLEVMAQLPGGEQNSV